jgi:NifU-like protein involved in Fe-S cluster formation
MYTEKVKGHFLSPHNVGPLEGATHVGRQGQPGLGNYMVFYLRVESGRIAGAAFQTYGCVGAIACGSELTDMVAGKAIEEALGIEPEDVLRSLGGLPLGKRHCAGLAIGALRNALAGGSG